MEVRKFLKFRSLEIFFEIYDKCIIGSLEILRGGIRVFETYIYTFLIHQYEKMMSLSCNLRVGVYLSVCGQMNKNGN